MTNHEKEILTLKLLDALKDSEIDAARGAWIMFHDTRPYSLSVAEVFLDEMWSDGLCINLGEPNGYKYRITQDGLDYLHDNLQLLLDHFRAEVTLWYGQTH